MRYFRRHWDEDRGDEYASWGTCTYYLALDERGEAHEQVEIYANGNVLAYDEEHDDDRFGFLTDAILDLDEFRPYEMTEEEFRAEVSSLKPINRGV